VVAQGTLLWQPVKFRVWSQTSPGTTFTPRSDWPIVRFQKIKWQYSRYIAYKFGELASNILGVYAIKRAIFAPIRPQILTTIFIRHHGTKQIGRSQFYFQKSNWKSFLYILLKFGEIWFGDPEV